MSLVPRSFFLLCAIAAGAGLTALAAVADGRAAREPARRSVTVDAPNAHVDAGRRTRVDAPYTHVDVDPDRRRVRVRAPYVDLDVKW